MIRTVKRGPKTFYELVGVNKPGQWCEIPRGRCCAAMDRSPTHKRAALQQSDTHVDQAILNLMRTDLKHPMAKRPTRE